MTEVLAGMCALADLLEEEDALTLHVWSGAPAPTGRLHLDGRCDLGLTPARVSLRSLQSARLCPSCASARTLPASLGDGPVRLPTWVGTQLCEVAGNLPETLWLPPLGELDLGRLLHLAHRRVEAASAAGVLAAHLRVLGDTPGEHGELRSAVLSAARSRHELLVGEIGRVFEEQPLRAHTLRLLLEDCPAAPAVPAESEWALLGLGPRENPVHAHAALVELCTLVGAPGALPPTPTARRVLVLPTRLAHHPSLARVQGVQVVPAPLRGGAPDLAVAALTASLWGTDAHHLLAAARDTAADLLALTP